ncbi:MAG TPA: dodecin family protein [Egibacteraceae bacterium]|nr:dodecin family protein [Actinomycetota bacterium]HWB71413.1 dodecin family protein [Egibacteraceae bacterium]
MPVASVSEITATSTDSFDDAIRQGVQRANQTLRNVQAAWVKDQEVRLQDGQISDYKVSLKVTFVLD